MGCVIYEMVALKRPFMHEHIPGLMNVIKNGVYDQLPEETSPVLKEMIEDMLEKDPENRPTIFELAKRPCIKKLINKIISNCEFFENVEAFFNIEYIRIMNSPATSKSQLGTPSTIPRSNFKIPFFW